MGTGAWVFLAVVVALVVWAVAIYKSLVALRNRFMNAFAQLHVQLNRRYELIARLDSFEAVMAARANALNAVQRAAAMPGNPAAMQALAQAEGALARALVEIGPNEKVGALQEELATADTKIGFARQAYNDSVMQYNTRRESFPDNIFAGMFGFTAAELLAATA
jgi:LemA protein